MKQVLILGAGTAGTMAANRLSNELDNNEWKITIVDKDDCHYYQPGFLFIPFGIYSRNDVIRPKRDYIPYNIEFIISDIELIDVENRQVKIKKDGCILHYDFLIIATGAQPRPDQTNGLLDSGWYHSIFDFYTIDGAIALAKFLRNWGGGHVVVNVVDTPIKCPVAPFMMKLAKNDLWDGVESIISAMDFMELSEGAQIIFI